MDFVDNYDNTMKEPTLLPASYPSVLVNANTGIAVGMASSICPFNLAEVCQTTIDFMKNPEHDLTTTLLAPDFPGGGQIIYEKKPLMPSIGRGGEISRCVPAIPTISQPIAWTLPKFRPPLRWKRSWKNYCSGIDSPGKAERNCGHRDETGLDGLKITIDLKRGVDAKN